MSPRDHGALIMAGLGHYYDRGDDPEIIRQRIGQFQRICSGAPAWALVEAWDAYLACNPKRRPTPADIRDGLDAVLAPYRKEVSRRKQAALPAPEPEGPTEESRARMKTKVEQVLAQLRGATGRETNQ